MSAEDQEKLMHVAFLLEKEYVDGYWYAWVNGTKK